ncbi:MAG: hypothetical protein GXP33_03775 [Spirochaetes bacterium]|nr:hypothetical protein [Spirochaetota bacterium]
MKQKVLIILIIIIFLIGCGGYKTKGGYVNKKNIDKYLYRLRKGITFNNHAVTKQRVLNDLEEYIDARKDKLYKGENAENEFELDKGLIYLYRSQFVKAFNTLRDYIDKTGDTARPFYNIACGLENQRYHLTDDIFGLAALACRETFPEPLDADQHVSAIEANLYYPLIQMYPYLIKDKEIINHESLTFDIKKKALFMLNKNLSKENIDSKIRINILPEKQLIKVLKTNITTDTLKYDYAVAYYIHPYRRDFEKAAYYADKRDYREWVLPFPSFRIPDLMRAYIGVGKYKKALDIYEYHKNKYKGITGESLTHINLLLAAAYAGLNNLEKSSYYLSREFEITEIRKDEPLTPSNMFRKRGDMLRSLFEMYFFFDEFRKYKGTRWEELTEDMINRNIGRYKDLRLFNR